MSKVFVSYLPAALVAINVASKKALSAACDVGRNQVVKNLSGARSGRTYKIPGTNVTYTASAPGEYPATRLGDLKGSYRVIIKRDTGYVGSDKEHALILEKKPVSKGGRPHLKPSLDQAKPGMLIQLHKRWF